MVYSFFGERRRSQLNIRTSALPPETCKISVGLAGLRSQLQNAFAGAMLLEEASCLESAVAREENSMMTARRCMLLTMTAAVLAMGHWPALAASRPGSPVAMFDTDNDGTLDLMEVKKAASALFTKLDRDHNGTVDKRELAGRLSAKELAAADPDHDGTLTLDEYLAVVEQRFNAANSDADGTLDAKELNSKAGRALLRLLK
jgi:hypothetical protein